MTSGNTTGFQLSPQQRRLWNLHTAGLPVGASAVISLDGELDAARLRAALQAVVERFEILRTSFQRSSGLKFPFQVVHDAASVGWSKADLTASTAEEQAKQIDTLLDVARQVDFAVLPTVKATLVALSTQRHALLVTLPNLCADLRAIQLLVEALAKSYAGVADAEEILQYADYSAWQNELAQGEEATQAAQFWQHHDPANVPPLALPLAKKTSAIFSLQNQTVPIRLDAQTKQRIEKTGLESFLLAAWQIFLGRMSGQAEVVTGFRSHGRHFEETKKAMGQFSRLLPLRSTFETDPEFSVFGEQIRTFLSQAEKSHDYVPEAYGDSQPTACFSMETTVAPHAAAGLTFLLDRANVPDNQAPLTLHVDNNSNGWNATLQFDPSVLTGGTANHFAGCFSALACGAASSPNLPLSRLPLLDRTERERVVVTFNRTEADLGPAACLHHLFEEQSRRTPLRPALRFGETLLSYAELNTRSNKIAYVLMELGVKSNVSVGLCVERSAEMIVGLLGILKAGGCYVPLVPYSPKARLAHQLAETEAPVLLTQEKLLPSLPEYNGTILCLDRDHAKFAAASSTNPERKNTPQDIAYVIYTSGSTGVPKGVAVPHSSLVNYSRFMERRLNLQDHPEGLHFATVSTIAADLGNTAVFPALVSGGCLHVIDFEMAMAANLFSEYSVRHPIHVLKITPSHLNTLLKAPGGEGVLPRKYLILGGEASSWEFVRQIMQTGKCAVLNHYGPTEATIGCCTFAVWENDVSAWQPAAVPVGKPIANDVVYILDRHLDPVPVGVAGELCVGGAGLALGYLKQPEQTAQRFVANPFQSFAAKADRIYRTGDLARFLPDGNIEFLGRIDDQVKIRGFRVEPAEIQGVLRKHTGVQQAVVTPYLDKNGEKRLAAYVVVERNSEGSAAGPTLKTEQLLAHIENELPDYMVPSSIIILDQLPLTPNGKIDFRVLPSPEAENAEKQRAFVAPSTPEEERMAAIWREVLKLDQVSVHDSFFELGGHSLLATQIISRIRNGFQVQMPLHSFLETPTVAELAEKVRHIQPAESEDAEMARLLEEVEGLSEEDAERLLAEHQDRGSGSK